MDLRLFYQKIKRQEAEFSEPWVIVVSLETGDGGRAGIKTEVHKSAAAKLIVENRARPATAHEAEEYRASMKAEREAQEYRIAAEKMHYTIISDRDLMEAKGKGRQPK